MIFESSLASLDREEILTPDELRHGVIAPTNGILTKVIASMDLDHCLVLEIKLSDLKRKSKQRLDNMTGVLEASVQGSLSESEYTNYVLSTLDMAIVCVELGEMLELLRKRRTDASMMRIIDTRQSLRLALPLNVTSTE